MVVWAVAFACGGSEAVSVPGPDVRLVPTALTFGEVALGATAEASFQVTNVGTHPAEVSLGAFGTGAFAQAPAFDAAVDAAGAPLVLDPTHPVLPPGAKLPVRVTFAPISPGPAVDALQVDTIGDDVATFADPRRPWQRLLVGGSAPVGEAPRAWPRFTRRTDLGWPTAPVTARLGFTNTGGADYTVTTASTPGCDRRFALVGAGLPAIVPPGGLAEVEVVFTPGEPAAARCDVVLTTDVPGLPTLTATVLANQACAGDHAPELVLVAPTSSISIPRDRDATVTIAVTDDERPVAALDCVVTSAALGRPVAACGLEDADPTVIAVPVASLYGGTTIDVWTVTVADACASSVVSVPVIVDGSWPLDDEDGDGFGPGSTPPDCDDRDADAYPGAAERDDAVDNDCDGAIDEATSLADDDDDGTSEVEGDCDDRDAAVHPAADEVANDVDDDCDGAIDEATAWSDDDGDGLAERDGDCDDADPTRRPGAGEALGDGVDDDCDGEIDEPADSRAAGIAVVASELRLSAARVGVGEGIDAAIRVGGPVTRVAWSADAGALSATEGAEVRWTAPSAPGTSRITAVVWGPDGAARTVGAAVIVEADPPRISIPASRGCRTPGAGLLAGLGGLLVRRRARRVPETTRCPPT